MGLAYLVPWWLPASRRRRTRRHGIKAERERERGEWDYGLFGLKKQGSFDIEGNKGFRGFLGKICFQVSYSAETGNLLLCKRIFLHL